MTEEDVELIRRLRSEQKFDYDCDRKGSSFIDLDSLRSSNPRGVAPSLCLCYPDKCIEGATRRG